MVSLKSVKVSPTSIKCQVSQNSDFIFFSEKNIIMEEWQNKSEMNYDLISTATIEMGSIEIPYFP